MRPGGDPWGLPAPDPYLPPGCSSAELERAAGGDWHPDDRCDACGTLIAEDGTCGCDGDDYGGTTFCRCGREVGPPGSPCDRCAAAREDEADDPDRWDDDPPAESGHNREEETMDHLTRLRAAIDELRAAADVAGVRLGGPSLHAAEVPEWAHDLLTQSWGMGVTAGRVDSATFDAVADAHFLSTDAARRWIGTEVLSATLLGELSVEGFYDLVVSTAGKYLPVYRAPDPTDTYVFRKVDLQTDTKGATSFAVQGDPECIYANQLPYDFRFKAGRWDGAVMATDDLYAAADQVESTSEQTAIGQTVRRRMRYRWLYTATGADDRTRRERLASTGDIEMVDLTLGPRGLALQPADVFSLIYSKYELVQGLIGTFFSVRSIEPDYLAMTAKISAWNIYGLRARQYQAPGADPWGSATAAAKEVYGYYSEAGQLYF